MRVSAALVVVGLLVAASARAETAAIEARLAGVSPDPALAQRIARLFERDGKWLAGARLRQRVEAIAEGLDPIDPGEIEAWARDLEAGYRLWIEGQIDQAAIVLDGATATLGRRPVALIQAPRLRSLWFRATVVLALVEDRNGLRGRAIERMTTLLRSFPDRTLDRKSFGPAAHGLYLEAEKRLQAAGRGTLVIEAPGAQVVYVDERRVGASSARLKLPVGEYRVVATYAGGERSLLHRVRIGAGGTETVAVDGVAERALVLEGGNAVVVLDAGASLGAGVARAAAELLAVDAVLVYAVIGAAADRRLLMLRYEQGTLVRAARVSLRAAPSDEALQALVSYVRGERGGLGVDTLAVAPHAPSPWPYVMAAAGGAVLGSGLVLLVLDGRGSCSDAATGTCPDVYDTATAGWIAAGVGASAMAAGIAWSLWPRQPLAPSWALGPGPGSAGLAVGARF